MSDLKTKALAEVCEIRPPKAEARRRLKADEFVSFVPMNDLSEGSKHFAARETRPLSAVDGSYTYFAENDVLLAKITPCFENGKLGIARHLTNGVGFGSSEFVVLRPRPSLDPEFLFYFLSRASFREEGAKRMTGAVGHKRIPKEFIENIQIPTPPLAEQRRIVAILDEAFAGLATMRANAEANLRNARALFGIHLNAVFADRQEKWEKTTLSNVASFKNGLNFTQSSRGETIKIIGVKDFQNYFWSPTAGLDTVQIDDRLSSEYELRDGDILTVRSNGNKQLIGRCMIVKGLEGKASHSGFTIRIRVTDNRVDPVFLARQLKSSAIRQKLVESGDGANISSLNQKALASLPVVIPSRDRQEAMIRTLEKAEEEADRLAALYEQKIKSIDALKQSILAKAFAGELTSPATVSANDNTLRSALVIALAYARHRAAGFERTFGHTKEQKIMHVVESEAGFYLGRNPQKDAAGPNDFRHMLAAEAWAEENRHFRVRDTGKGYRLEPLERFDALLRQADAIDPDKRKAINRVIDVFLPMNMREAELFATVYAAWNNLKLDGEPDTDDAIFREAREDWHPKKLEIPRSDFVKALAAVRRSGLIPTGKGMRVGERQLRLA